MKKYLEFILEYKKNYSDNEKFLKLLKNNYELSRKNIEVYYTQIYDIIDNVDNIDFSYSEGRTALFYVVFLQNYDLIKKILEKGADIDKKDSCGLSVIMYASSHYDNSENSDKIFELLLSYNPELDYFHNGRDISSIKLLIGNRNKNRLKQLKMLIDNNAYIRFVNSSIYNYDTLSITIYKNHLDYFIFFIKEQNFEVDEKHIDKIIGNDKDLFFKYVIENDIIEFNTEIYNKIHIENKKIYKYICSYDFQKRYITKNNALELFNILPIVYINSKIKKEYSTALKTSEYGF
jgi:ankyrin repeat protein